MFEYYNANPRGRRVNDCTVRAISLATARSWDETYRELCDFAQSQAIMPNEVEYIDEYLSRRFNRLCGCRGGNLTLGDFLKLYPKGTYLVTMSGHITCCINGVVYDTFDPRERYVWDIYIIK